MGLCHHQIMARAEKGRFFSNFCSLPIFFGLTIFLTFVLFFCGLTIFFVVSPEDQVLWLEVEVGDLADQGASRAGEHSDRVNSWVRSEDEQAL